MPTEFVDPGDVNDGDVGDPVYGDAIRANQQMFNGFFTNHRIVNSNSTVVSVTNSTAETTILTYTIPGGTLSTGNAVFFQLWCRVVNGSGGDRNADLTLKYGSTELITGVGGIDGSSSVDNLALIEGALISAGTTSSQHGFLVANRGSAVESNFSDYGSAAEDSTGDLDLVVTMQWPISNANLTFYKYYSLVAISEV